MIQIFYLAILLTIPIAAPTQDINLLLKTHAPSEPFIFAPAIISDELNNRDFTISPNGNEIFSTIQSAKFLKSTIIYLNKTNGIWSPPSIAPFSGKSRDLEAFFSTDGKTVFFSSDRQINDADSINDFDIWKVEKEKSG